MARISHFARMGLPRDAGRLAPRPATVVEAAVEAVVIVEAVAVEEPVVPPAGWPEDIADDMRAAAAETASDEDPCFTEESDEDDDRAVMTEPLPPSERPVPVIINPTVPASPPAPARVRQAPLLPPTIEGPPRKRTGFTLRDNDSVALPLVRTVPPPHGPWCPWPRISERDQRNYQQAKAAAEAKAVAEAEKEAEPAPTEPAPDDIPY